MAVARFLDTNVILSAYDIDAPQKRAIALQILRDGWDAPGTVALSVQVLQELHVNLTRRGVTLAEATAIVRDFDDWPVVETTHALLLAALDEQARWRISLWDALILAAARTAGAAELVTEDLNDGQDYGGVRVWNPFARRSAQA